HPRDVAAMQHGAEQNVEITFLDAAVTRENELIGQALRTPGRQHGLDGWFAYLGDLRARLGCRQAEGRRMRLAEQRDDGVVVDEHGIGAPEDPRRLRRIEAAPDRRNERRGPRLDGTEMLPGLATAQQRAHLTRSVEQ